MISSLEEGDSLYGFKVSKKYNLFEYKSIGIELEHSSGAKVFHILNDDIENTFAFCFNTPVENSTGVPHIIEHSVLSGSRLYDLKDPFQGMMKGSVNTFLNAYTFPDKTCYPASTVLEKDFYNLMSVYADAVFFPRLKKDTFLQEGWRLEVDSNGELSYSGIVYNEMKGVYSSHESHVQEASVKVLFDNGSYIHDSGGAPESIPKLTYNDFLEYHKEWYHPSNCYIYLYGNISTEKHLEFLNNKFLGEFKKKDIHFPKDKNTSWASSKRFNKFSPIDGENTTKSDLLLSWKLTGFDDPEQGIALEILNKILLGSNGAPLREALTKSNLWEDLSVASGLENELSNYVFTIGVRGADPSNFDAFKKIVLDTLAGLTGEKGLDKDLVEGALRVFEFNGREIHNSFGLRLFRRTIRGWMRGYSPLTTLEFEERISAIREKVSTTNYFEELISRLLINNNHYAEIIVEPSNNEYIKQQSLIEEELLRIKSSLSPNDIQNIRDQNKKLLEYQNQKDSIEAVNSLPRLTKDDIPVAVREIPTVKVNYKGYDLYKTDIYTNGVVYLGIGFNMEYLDNFFFSYMLIFTRVLTQMGFVGMDYQAVSNQLSLKLGGISASMETSNSFKNQRPHGYLENFYIRTKFLETGMTDAIDLVKNFLTKVDFHDLEHLKSLIIEIRNDLKSSLVSSGTSYASLRTARKFSLASCREEAWYGVTQAQFLEDLVSRINQDGVVEEVAKILDSIKKQLFSRQGVYFHISSQDNYQSDLEEQIDSIIDSLEDGTSYIHPPEHYDIENRIEALIGNTTVSYTGLTVKGSFLGSKEDASQNVLCEILKTGYLWENIRMKGGAYGAFVSPSEMDGSITFGSYRDPNISSTISHFKESLEWLAAGNVTQEEIDMAIITLVGKDLRPLIPVEKTIIGHRRLLLGITTSLRQDKRDRILSLKPEDIMDFAAGVLHYWDEHSLAVVSSKEGIDLASKNIPDLGINQIILPK